MKKRFLAPILTLFFLAVLVGSNIGEAYASFTYTTITMPASYSNDLTNSRFLQLTNGKILVAWMEIVTASSIKVTVKQYAQDGSLDTTYNSPTYTGLDTTAVADSHKLKVYPLNSSKAVIVFVTSTSGGSASIWDAYAITWDSDIQSIEGDIDTTTLASVNDGGNHDSYRCSNLDAVAYSDNIYFIVFANAGSQVDKQYISVITYDVGADTLSDSTTNVGSTVANSEVPRPLFLYQNPTDLDQVYFITTRVDLDVDQPIVYRVDLDTGTIEVMLTASDGIWGTYYMFLMGAGIYEDTDYYLFFNLVKPFLTGDEHRFKIFQLVLKFTGTIDLAGLVASDYRESEFNPYLPHSVSLFNWVVGYTTDYNSFRVIFPELSATVYYAMYCDVEVTDFTDFDLATFDLGTWTIDNSVPVESDTPTVGWNEAYTSMLQQKTSTAILFYGISPQSTAFDVTFSWLPYDVPLVTSRTYTYTVGATLNGYAWEGRAIAVYLDGAMLYWKIPNSGGEITFTYNYGATGSYNYTIQLYDTLMGLVYSESFPQIVTQGATTVGEGAGYILPSFFAVFTGIVPAFMIIGIPAFFLGDIGRKAGLGVMGFIFGAILGVGLGYMIGVIPVTVFYLAILFVAVMLIMTVRSKFSGGD